MLDPKGRVEGAFNNFAETNNRAKHSQPKNRLIGNHFPSRFASRRNLIALLILIVLATTIIAYIITRNTPPSSIDGIPIESGYTAVVGNKTVSDGRISITINNYHFEEAKDIDFVPSLPAVPSSVFMFINVTVANVDSGNTSIGPSFAYMQNGSSIISNTNFVRNISFPVGMFPNQAYPENSGGIYLPPTKATTFWYLFYVPYSESLGLSGVSSTVSLKALVYYEQFYGGDYLGDGAYTGSKDLKVEFIVLP